MKTISRFLGIFLCAGLVLALLPSASADQQLPVMNAYTSEQGVTLFVQDPGASVEQVYVGNEVCQDFTVSEPGAMRTVVILDNSLSIQEHYRAGIKTFLSDLVAARQDGDTFTIVTFAQDVSYLTQDDSDYLAIKEKIDSISFSDQESYFTKAVYRVLSDIAEDETDQYTRVIIIADGAENEALGYTDEELFRKVQAVQVPIYTIGCTANNNAENLKKMFSLSRMSNGKDYLIDDTGFSDILQDIVQDNRIIRVAVTPAQSLSDGTVRAVRVRFEGGAYAAVEIAMPFLAAQDTGPAAESTPPGAVPSAQPEAPAAPAAFPAALIVILALAGAAILLILILLAAKKKRAAAVPKPEPIDLSCIGHASMPLTPPAPSGGTAVFPDDGEPRTAIMPGMRAVRLCLRDLRDPSRHFECPIRGLVRIGANPAACQIVIDYDKYVSAIHCEVFARGDGFVVRDGEGGTRPSTNGTYVNDQRAAPELPLPPNAVLRLGAVTFEVAFQ